MNLWLAFYCSDNFVCTLIIGLASMCDRFSYIRQMINVPPFKAQEICCDATSPNIPEKASFFFKSSYHKHDVVSRGRVHIDFSLHVIQPPAQPLGIWRCRVNYWLQDATLDISYEQGLDYFKDGFRRALAEAELFVKAKYKFQSVFTPPTDEELLVRYKAILAKQEAANSEVKNPNHELRINK